MAKKYNICKVNYVTVDYKDYLAPLDYSQCPKSRLPKPIQSLLEEISSVTLYQRAMSTELGIDTNVLPFSGISKKTIVKAREIL